MVKNQSAVQEMRVPSLGQEDPLEESMTTHSSIFAGKILWPEEPGRLWSMESQKSWTRLKPLSTYTLIITSSIFMPISVVK